MNEEWKDIEGFENWQISNTGHVKSPNKVLKPFFDQRKYYMVDLGKTKRIHRLVAEHFIPNPEGKPQVNHIDGDKTNNHVSNLEWCTNQENMTYACEAGLYSKNRAKGAANGNSKLQREEVIKMKEILKQPKRPSYKAIGKLFNVTASTVCDINNGKIWSHV